MILPVINETTALRETVEIIRRDVKPHLLKELLVVVCPRTTPGAMAAIAGLQVECGELMVVLHQRLPRLGGAIREGFAAARGSHVIMMASDLETDPNDVRVLIEAAQENPAGIVTASRWLGGGRFSGYSRFKLVCNWIFQQIFAVLYATRLTDLTYAYRIFPTKLVQAIQWREVGHPFLFETILNPLRLGVAVTEIPSSWRARTEGESQNSFLGSFAYFRTGIVTRFIPRRAILRTGIPASVPAESGPARPGA